MTTQKYNAIIIGAGLGALSAAGYLAKAGKRVLLLKLSKIFQGGKK